MTKVKICGITQLEDAQIAVEAGADAIGFVFAESPRHISPEVARDILQQLDMRHCVPVGVFVNEAPERMIEVAGIVGLHVLQLHGDEPPDIVEEMHAHGFDTVKSFRVSTERISVLGLEAYRPTAFLLDTFVRTRRGGTGQTFDWQIALEAKRHGRVILAGGLGVDNVLDAIEQAAPYGVDASSRLEIHPGRKDPEKVRQFVRLVKSQGPADSARVRESHATAGPVHLEGRPWPR